jgi:hypothetical protein
MPALGLSLFLIAVGAILAFAVNVSVSGVSIYAVGIILMIVGAVGLLLSLLFWTSFAPFGRHDTTVDDGHRDVHVH